jgi:hypothetical protein
MRRRTWLALGAGSAVALLLAGGSLALLQPGLRDAKLSAGGREVFAGAARGLLAGTLPSGAQPLEALLSRIDALVANLPPHAQQELSQLLSILASSPGRRALAGLATPWTAAGVGDIQAALQGMRVSSISLRQQAYQALHDIVGAAYFSDRSTWTTLAYPGPVAI